MNRKYRTDNPTSPDDLNDIFVNPVKLTSKQIKEASLQLAEARKKVQASATAADLLRSAILKLRFQMEDYIFKHTYDPSLNFGHFLKEYVDIQNKKRKTFAEEISIDDAMLSNYINQHRTPPGYIPIRLEIHSNNLIPAQYWYKLVEKETEHFIKTDKKVREKEKKFVQYQVPAGI